MTKNAVELRNVSFTYAGFDAPAIDDASFAVAPGECVVLCEESGCGKTTATRIVNGLAGGFYEGSRTGKVLVAGRDIDDLEDWELSSLTGSVFQNPRTQFFNLDTTGEIAFGMENLGVPREEMHRRVRGVVRELGMERLMGRGIFELSGGQMQSVAFASAWACRPSVYVLDEPSSNLDPPSMEKLASFISKAKSSGSAVIIAEHRLSYLAGVADRYLLFEGGSVAAEWDAQQFLELPDSERESCGLRSSEPPKLADLMQCLSRPVSAFPAVEARGIYAGYEKGVPVLEGTTVSFDPGRVVGVVGRNGAGKSTLLKCLAGIKKEELGHVRFQGSVVPPPREGPSMCFWSCRTPTTSSFARACATSWHPRPRLLPTSTNFVSKRSWRSLAWEMSPTAIPHRSREGRSRGASAPSRRSRTRWRFSSTSPRAAWISGTWNASRSSCAKRRLAGRRWRSSVTTRSSCQRPATRLCSSSEPACKG